ncbi:MAG: hypothetical protein HKL91_06290 [Candidatus Eremiobacteraeota bacterium]|nr:hypothetical protein [Candidatus Eremiobacteraeota bacterium]
MQIALLLGDIEAAVPVVEQPAVVVRGRARQRDDGSWLVTLFLVNKQTSVKSNADERWLFQAALTVRAPDGRPIFLERSHSERTQSETDGERAQLAMLYRGALEFAVGHGVAVRAERAPGEERRAVSVETCNVPTYELARTDQPNVAENRCSQHSNATWQRSRQRPIRNFANVFNQSLRPIAHGSTRRSDASPMRQPPTKSETPFPRSKNSFARSMYRRIVRARMPSSICSSSPPLR